MRTSLSARLMSILGVVACIPVGTWAGGSAIVPAASRSGYAIPSYLSGAAVVGTHLNTSLNGVPSLPAGLGLSGLGAPRVELSVPGAVLPTPAPVLVAPASVLAAPEPVLPSEAAAPGERKGAGTPGGLVDAVKSAVKGGADDGAELRSVVGSDLVETPKTDIPVEGQQDWAERSFEKLKGGEAPIPVTISEVAPSVNPSGLAEAGSQPAESASDLPTPPASAAPSKGKAETFLDSHPQLKESLLSGLELFGPLIGTAFFGGAIFLSFTYLPLFAAIGTIPLAVQVMAKPMAAFHRFQDARIEQRYAADREEALPLPETPQVPGTGDQTSPAPGPVAEPKPAPSEPVEAPQPVPSVPIETPQPAVRLSPDARSITRTALRLEAEKAAERATRIDPKARLVEARIDLQAPSSHWVFVFQTKDRVITVWQKRIGVRKLTGPRLRTLETRRLSYMGKLEDAVAKAGERDPKTPLKTARIVRTPDGARYDFVER